MSLIEFIGFIITMVLVIYLQSKRMVDDRKRRSNPEYYEEEEEGPTLEEMLGSMNLNPDEAKALERELRGPTEPPPPPHIPRSQIQKTKKKIPKRTLSDQYELHSKMEDFEQQTNIEKRKLNRPIEHRYEKKRKPVVSQGLRVDPYRDPYALERKGENRIHNILKSLDSKQNMIILHEILDKPKALKDDTISW